MPLVLLVAKKFVFLRLQNFVLTSRDFVLCKNFMLRTNKWSVGNLLPHAFKANHCIQTSQWHWHSNMWDLTWRGRKKPMDFLLRCTWGFLYNSIHPAIHLLSSPNTHIPTLCSSSHPHLPGVSGSVCVPLPPPSPPSVSFQLSDPLRPVCSEHETHDRRLTQP